MIGLSASVFALVVLALIGFGGTDAPFAGVFGSDGLNPAEQTLTAIAVVAQSATATDMPTDTPSPTPTDMPSPTPTNTPTPTDTPSPTPTDTLTPTPTDTPTPTETPSPTVTDTPTPDLTTTAVAYFVETQTAASPTPDMTQTLAACDFEYIIVAPDQHNVPPALEDATNPRLIRVGTPFTFDIIFQNTGSCAWPRDARLTFNRELTLNPDETVNLEPFREACDTDARPGLNFARQEQSNFFLTRSVGIVRESEPLTFIGTAPTQFGCYYGVWDLLYPGSNVRIGRPLVLTIRTWGG